MIENTISTETARRFYDRLGRGHDWAEFYDSQAKKRALALLDLAPGQNVLNVGVGTGKAHQHIQSAVAPGGTVYGLDLSTVMLKLAYARTSAVLCEGDARALPFAAASFDRLISTYVLDLLPAGDLAGVLAGFRHVLKPDGRTVIVSLTEGVNNPSRLVVALWKAVYALSPIACGGCRPLELSEIVGRTGFREVEREVLVQLGVPSEVIVAQR